ncbi:MAG TPA: gamma-glutamyltransferase [Verrucomicrobiales bacterium]|nr:gamma-glutamyltransferase [Verrucomicrobiales bacterium]
MDLWVYSRGLTHYDTPMLLQTSGVFARHADSSHRVSAGSYWDRHSWLKPMARYLALSFLLVGWPDDRGVSWVQAGAVSTVHPLATQAAMEVMKEGGNAVDAAVAAGLTLGVVDGFNSGIGGGCFLLIRTPRGEIVGIDGREAAPATAHQDMYLKNGEADPSLSQSGPLAIAVPGALAAYEWALSRFGKRSLSTLIMPAARIAENGFLIDEGFHSRIRGVVERLREFSEAADIFLDGQHRAHPVGHRLVQSDLAKTYRSIGDKGVEFFYRGPFADSVEQWMKRSGGKLMAQDLAAYRAIPRPPIRSRYRQYDLAGFPPPSSGGVHVAQILNILQHFSLREKGMTSADWAHLVVEAMKLAFADRAYWLGDADFVPVPNGLVDVSYARALAERIDPERALDVPSHGQPPHAHKSLFGSHTTHFSTADEEGWWVACTATVNTTLGSKVVIPDTGVVMNNEMDDFSAQPGKPNFFGLMGSQANAIRPGKRPLSSMSPTLVSLEGEPVYALGGAGGPTIISQTVLHLILMIDFGLTPEQALAHPRLHHQWSPDQVVLEEGWPASVIEGLRDKGHDVRIVPSLGVSQIVARPDKEGSLQALSDPRVKGSGMAYTP